MSTFNPIGSKKVTIGSGATSLGSSYPAGSLSVNRVDIQASLANVGNVVIGDSTIAADGSNGGIALIPGQVYNIEIITDLRYICVNGTSGDSVTINWWIGDRA